MITGNAGDAYGVLTGIIHRKTVSESFSGIGAGNGLQGKSIKAFTEYQAIAQRLGISTQLVKKAKGKK